MRVLAVARGRRCYSTSATALPLLSVSKAEIFKFGDGPPKPPLFGALEWTVHEHEAWAVVGRGSARKTQLLEALRGNLRIHPPPSPPHGLWPALTASGLDPYASVSLLTFTHRQGGSEFVDYTARYGALRDGDRTTLGDTLPPITSAAAHALAQRLGFPPGKTWDMPLVALSNGQTRRARLLRALLAQPAVLLLDEPLTGLDVHVRKTVSCVLRDAHAARAPRVLLGLRAQDPVPNWITHVLDVDPPASVGAAVWAGPREAWQSLTALAARAAPPPVVAPRPKNGAVARAPLVEMRGVRVAYGARAVLDGIDWTIRPGERWHLAGGNGAGKTTLLALLSGEHPLSYAQRHLHLWGRRRNAWPAAELRKRVGVVSPEAADALPRVAGRSVWAVVGTGWEGAFVPAGADGVGHVEGAERDARVRRTWEVLAALGPAAWGDVPSAPPPPSVSVPAGAPDAATRAFATKEYMDLAPGERSAVLLARALVARPPLLLLDEAWAGMDARQVGAARAFLRSDVGAAQAAVVVSHWEEEVPWTGHEVRRLRLEEGRASVEV